MVTTLNVIIKTIDKSQEHYEINIPFCTGVLKYEYYDDLFGFEHYKEFLTMVKNHLKPDKIEVLKK